MVAEQECRGILPNGTPGRTCQRVVDHGLDHPTPMELIGSVRLGPHGTAERTGGACGGEGVADLGLGETANQGSNSIRFGAPIPRP